MNKSPRADVCLLKRSPDLQDRKLRTIQEPLALFWTEVM